MEYFTVRPATAKTYSDRAALAETFRDGLCRKIKPSSVLCSDVEEEAMDLIAVQ